MSKIYKTIEFQKITKRKFAALLAFVICLTAANFARAQTTAFTYQGRITNGGAAANGAYLMQFRLFDSPTVGQGNEIGTAVEIGNIQVVDGIFTVQLDFTALPFAAGQNRYLEITIRQPTTAVLSPRQLITPAPTAIRSATAATADTATTATTATNFTGSLSGGVSGPQGATTVLSVGGQSAASVGNAASTVAAATSVNSSNTLVRRDASGNFSGSVVTATAQFNLGGSRILAGSSPNNLFVGIDTGTAITSGGFNTFVGAYAGSKNTGGGSNTFIGSGAGFNNETGTFNSFLGSNAGINNATGDANSFFGDNAGNRNTSGGFNSFFGTNAGAFNQTGAGNTFVGRQAGDGNTIGGNNTLLGNDADVGANNLNYAAAVGANAVVAQSDTIVLGKTAGTYGGVARPADAVQIPGNLSVAGSLTGNFSVPAANVIGVLSDAQLSANIPRKNSAGNVFSGSLEASNISANGNLSATGGLSVGGAISGSTVNAATQFNLGGQRILSTPTASSTVVGKNAGTLTTGSGNSFFGFDAGSQNTSGFGNSFFGRSAGAANDLGYANSFFGSFAGEAMKSGDSNTFVGQSAGMETVDGDSNSFFGSNAGQETTSGDYNTFIGVGAGNINKTGNNNTAIGLFANTGSDNLSYATAIGSRARANFSDTVVIGKAAGTYYGEPRPADAVQIPGTLAIAGGAAVARILTAAANLDFPSLGTNQNATLTISVSGAQVGDAVTLGLPSSLVAEFIYTAYVSAANTVTVRVRNLSQTSGIDAPAQTFRVVVIGF